MPVSRPSDDIEEWVEAALEANDEGEAITFEILLGAHPTEGLMVMLSLSIPSFTLGESCVAQMTLPYPCPKEIIDEGVPRFLAGMRAQRSELAKNQINGSGLHLPGSPG